PAELPPAAAGGNPRRAARLAPMTATAPNTTPRRYTPADAEVVLTRRPRLSEVQAVALSDDEGLAAAGAARGELVLLRGPGGEVAPSPRPHRARVTGLAFAPGRLLASGGRAGVVRLWDCSGDSPRELMDLPAGGPVRGVAFDPGGLRLGVL